MPEAPWEVRAEAAGPIVDIQAKALKASLTETDPAVREAYLRMAEAAELAFALVVPEAAQAALLAKADQQLKEGEAEALGDCIAVAARVGSSYEIYGGVNIPKSVRLATDALERLGVPVETEVIE